MNVFASRNNINTAMADSATFTIISSSNWPGYCGNGSLPNESPILPSPDFSFEATSDLDEISGIINGDKLSAPIYCKDYGAWCEVAITLKKGGIPIQSEPIRLRIPRDANGDKIADCWQDKQIREWNQQFGTSRPLTDFERSKMKPGAGYTYADYADDEEADSDGPSDRQPPMANIGDALSVLDEYRGYILDLGDGISYGDHKRLSISRKEVLLQIHEMPEITDSAQNNANPAAQQFNLDTRFRKIANFYADSTQGSEIDLYAVKIPISNCNNTVTYNDSSSRPAYVWTGALEPLANTSRPASGISYVYRDNKLLSESVSQHTALYGSFIQGVTQGRENTFARLREPYWKVNNLSKFTLCSAFTRFALLADSGNGITAREYSGNATSNHLAKDSSSSEPTEDPHPEWRGIQLSVNAMSEEGNPACNSQAFNDVFEYSFAHEIGHALIWSRHSGHPALGPGLVSDYPPVPKSLAPIIIQDSEIGLIDLRHRLSITP